MSQVALSDSGNDRIAMGGNMSAFDAHKVNIDDLFEEAEVWLNGDGVQSAAEADAVEKLLDLVREAKKAADEARRVENEPFDAGKAAVQARYNPILKRAELVAETCKNVLKPWRDKIAAEKAQKAETARLDAEKLQREAEEKLRTSAGNITERVRAEEAVAFAKDAAKFANHTAKDAAVGTGLRRSYRAVMTDGGKAAEHYWTAKRGEFQAFLSELAAQDVRRGVRSIPGFDVIEETKAV